MVGRSHDYVVIGAGPAGLQLSYLLRRSGRDHVVLEAGEAPGRFFTTMPRHRRLLSINKRYTGSQDAELNLRWDWNSLLGDPPCRFGDFDHDYFPSADSMVDYLTAYAARHELPVEYRTAVTAVEGRGPFLLTTADGRRITCRRLVVATGPHAMHVPDIPGIELADRYDSMSVDPLDFLDQRVLVIGKGNSAFETADNLIPTAALVHVLSPTPLEFAWRTHFAGHLRAVNNNFLDTYQLKSQNAVIDATITAIERAGGEFVVSVSYSHAVGEREQLRYDRVLTCTGFRFADDIFAESCRPDLNPSGRLPAQTPAWESVNVPDLYFAGFLMSGRDKTASSPFVHGFRYNVRALSRIFDVRYHGRPWPSRRIDTHPDVLAASLLERINRSSALWQQFGVLADVVCRDGAGAFHYEEVPVAYAVETEPFASADHIRVTLEYGPRQEHPFAVQRHPRPQQAHNSIFLHPVLRHHVGGRVADEHHLLENLYGEWRDPEVHHAQLSDWLRRCWPVTGEGAPLSDAAAP